MEMNSLNDFVKSIPNNLETVIEKVRYLYLELGKRSFYDPEYKYFMFDEEEQYMCYSNKSYSNPNIIVCTTLAKQFVELLIRAGIKAELAHQDDHYLVSFYDENGKSYLADITNDLKNIQFGCRTSYFGKDTISTEDISKIDLKLGYITTKRSYINDYWYLVKEAVSNPKLSMQTKLDLVLNNLQKYADMKKLGDTEVFALYQKFIRYCLPDTSGISFYSTKNNKFGREKCVIELCDGNQKNDYVLNYETRLFEQQRQPDKHDCTLLGDEK